MSIIMSNSRTQAHAFPYVSLEAGNHASLRKRLYIYISHLLQKLKALWVFLVVCIVGVIVHLQMPFLVFQAYISSRKDSGRDRQYEKCYVMNQSSGRHEYCHPHGTNPDICTL